MRAVITGATGGIGSKTAEILGLAGYEVILTDVNDTRRDEVLDHLQKQGIKASFTFAILPVKRMCNAPLQKLHRM